MLIKWIKTRYFCNTFWSEPNEPVVLLLQQVNSTVPIASEVFKLANVYNEKKIFGVTTLDIVRANTFIRDLTVSTFSHVICRLVSWAFGSMFSVLAAAAWLFDLVMLQRPVMSCYLAWTVWPLTVCLHDWQRLARVTTEILRTVGQLRCTDWALQTWVLFMQIYYGWAALLP